MNALGVIRVELLVDRRQRGRRAGDGDPLAGGGNRLAGQFCVDQRAHVACQRIQLRRVGRVGPQVALRVANGPGLKGGVEADLAPGADHQLGRAAADVDHQGAVRRRRPLGEGAEIDEPRLLGSVEDAGVELETLPKLGDERPRVRRVPHRAGGDRVHALHTQRLVGLDVLGDRAADLIHCLAGELARGVDAAPQPGHGRAPLELRHPAVGDVRDQQPRRVGPDVHDRHAHPRHPTDTGSRVGALVAVQLYRHRPETPAPLLH